MIKFIIIMSIMLCLPGCVYAIRVDGPYEGKIIDAETGEPIEGVVVLGTWYTTQITPAGGSHTFYDARETITDKNGRFSIPGKGLRVLSNLEPMNVTIFKAGYEFLDVSWVSFKKDILLSKKIKWEGNKPIIPLKKWTTLTMQEKKILEALFPPLPPTDAPKEKVILLLREINKEMIERGIEPVKTWKGEKI